jgi:hypothetical protein
MKTKSLPKHETPTTEQGHLISLSLDTPVSCPECSHTFALREGLGNPTIAQLKARQAEFQSAREQEIQARIEQERAAAAEKAARELTQRHAAESRRIAQELESAKAENADLLKQQGEIAKERQGLLAERRNLADARSKLDYETQRKLDAAAETARAERERIKKAFEAKLRDAAEHSLRIGREQAKAEQGEAFSRMSAELEAARKQANQHSKLLQQAELAKLDMEERLQSQRHAMEIELKKESNRLRKQLAGEFEQANKALLAEALESERSKATLKLQAAEVEKAQLLAKVENLHRQLEQKSQQVQGEALETLMESRLAEVCPDDAIEAIKTGVNGADLLHSVYNERGAHVGNISWEIKNTKHWKAAWLAKLAEDARKCGSSAAVLVTTALPPEMTTKVAYMDGCWVCSVDAWEGLALLLRSQVIEMARLEKGLEQRGDKAAKLYTYLQSAEFRSAATSMLNTLSAMQTQVEKEERAFGKQWKLRREQLRRLIELHMEHTRTIEVMIEQNILNDEFLADEEAVA